MRHRGFMVISPGDTIWYKGEKFWLVGDELGFVHNPDGELLPVVLAKIAPIEGAMSTRSPFTWLVPFAEITPSLISDICFSSEWALGMFGKEQR